MGERKEGKSNERKGETKRFHTGTASVERPALRWIVFDIPNLSFQLIWGQSKKWWIGNRFNYVRLLPLFYDYKHFKYSVVCDGCFFRSARAGEPDNVVSGCVSYIRKHRRRGVGGARAHTRRVKRYAVVFIISTWQGCVLGLDVSVSRRSRDVPTSHLGLISRKSVNVSVSSRSRPFTSRAQDQFSAKLCRPQYAVWTGFRRCKPML